MSNAEILPVWQAAFIYIHLNSFFFFLPQAISDYKQPLQFQSLNEEKRNIHLRCIYHYRKIFSPLLIFYLFSILYFMIFR